MVKPIEKDWDALDNTLPYTAVGMLSWALWHQSTYENSKSVEITIQKLLDSLPREYRW